MSSWSARGPEQGLVNAGGTGFDQFLTSEGLSGELYAFVKGAYKANTIQRYDAIWYHFAEWCSDQEIFDPRTVRVNTVLAYLHQKFESGVQKSTLDVTISALAHHLRGTAIEGLAQNPLVKLFQRSVFLNRPPRGKVYPKWDVSALCGVLKATGPPHSLDLSDLTRKTATLLSLVLAARCDSLTKIVIDPHFFDVQQGVILVRLRELPKGARPNNPNLKDLIKIYQFSDDIELDPYAHVLEYISRTKNLRGTQLRLFLSYTAPYKPVTASTIGKWIVSFLKVLPGGSNATAHSVRGVASTYAEVKGVSLDNILLAADWSNANTFFQHYRIPDVHRVFQTAVLHEDD
jgi:hypothetical protein